MKKIDDFFILGLDFYFQDSYYYNENIFQRKTSENRPGASDLSDKPYTSYDGYFRPGGQTIKGFAEVGVPQFDANDDNFTIKEFNRGILGFEVLKAAD